MMSLTVFKYLAIMQFIAYGISFGLKEDGVKLKQFYRKLLAVESNYSMNATEMSNDLDYICSEGCTRECDRGCTGGCDSEKCNTDCDESCDSACNGSCDGSNNNNNNNNNYNNNNQGTSCDECYESCDESCDEGCSPTSCDEGCTGGCDAACNTECELVNISLITGEWITYYDDQLGENVTTWDFSGRSDKDVADRLSNNAFYVLLSSVAAFFWI